MDPDLQGLIPVFLEEARDRLERLASGAPRVEKDRQTLAEAKRELHTLKGASRMLRIPALAELAHAAEEMLVSERPGKSSLLTRVADRLSGMVEEVAAGEEPAPDGELLGLLATPQDEARGEGSPPDAAAPDPATGTAAQDPGEAEETGAASGPADDEEGKVAKPERSRSSRRPKPSRRAAARRSPPEEPSSAADAAAAASEEEPAVQPGAGAPAGPKAPAASGDVRLDSAALDAVADRATQVRIMALANRQLSERLYELGHLAEQGLREPQPTQVLAVLASMLRRMAVEVEGSQRRLARSADSQLESILTLQLQPLRGFLLTLARHARELGRSLGREVEVEVEGEETRLDRRIVRELEDALLHLLRNAVDHGIETPAERRVAGKPPVGTVRLTATATGSRVRLEIADDGAGIDPGRVAEQAVRQGVVDRATLKTFSEADLFRLLFASGFSTRRQVSEISGRGLGLDIVASAVARVGGEVFLDSDPGEGTQVTLEVPVARRGEQVLLVRVGQHRLALPSGVVRRAVALNPEAVVERDGRTLARVDGRLVPFLSLDRVYGEPEPEQWMILEGEVSGQPLAVGVDEVIQEEEVLVRPMTRSVPTDRLLDGIALLASGEPVGVLAPAVLAQRDLLRAKPVTRERRVDARVRVLLVDDSLVTREMERRLLEDAGFEVAAASDAEEALTSLGESRFDCLVTDIEMPGMDGFELTSHLRGIEHFAQLPIIVVSTRDRPEDRLRGLKAGADAYLTKQSLDAGELVDLVRRLGGAA